MARQSSALPEPLAAVLGVGVLVLAPVALVAGWVTLSVVGNAAYMVYKFVFGF